MKETILSMRRPQPNSRERKQLLFCGANAVLELEGKGGRLVVTKEANR